MGLAVDVNPGKLEFVFPDQVFKRLEKPAQHPLLVLSQSMGLNLHAMLGNDHAVVDPGPVDDHLELAIFVDSSHRAPHFGDHRNGRVVQRFESRRIQRPGINTFHWLDINGQQQDHGPLIWTVDISHGDPHFARNPTIRHPFGIRARL